MRAGLVVALILLVLCGPLWGKLLLTTRTNT